MADRHQFQTVTPESVGVPSAAVERFLKRLTETKRFPMHSVLLLRDGKIFSETYWKPFNAERKHRMYSVSKSFTSAAIGMLIGDGKIALNDPIVKYFPDMATEPVNRYMADTTIRDLLMMSTCNYRNAYSFETTDWARDFIAFPSDHWGGHVFSYDTAATTTLDVLIKRVSGMELCDFLRDRLFRPAGMSEDIWCVQTPCGHDWGGSGIQATPRDLAKFAVVCANGGSYNGQQLIPEDYIRAATSWQIDNTVRNSTMCEQQGYGYQFWQAPHNGWAMLGMGSQNALVFPEQRLIVITTADTQGYSTAIEDIYDAIFDELFPYLEKYDSLPENEAGYKELLAYSETKDMPLLVGEAHSDIESAVTGKTYKLSENVMGIESVKFDFEGEQVKLTWVNENGVQELNYGLCCYVEDTFPETHYEAKKIGTPENRGLECHSTAAWVEPASIRLTCYATDVCMGNLHMQFTFDGDTVTLLCTKNAENFFHKYIGFASGTCA
ncbi:MAG: serine hydrolase [Clostridia bacterium]|nr:serine hydrolase [Clostridia bacterium]